MSSAIDGDAYRSLFDQNPQAMWVFDRESFAFLAVNEAALRQYGYSREEFLARSILDIRPAEDVDRVRASVAGGLSQPAVWNHVRKDGTVIQVEVTAHNLQFNDRPARLAMAIDVTERERNAQTARRREQMLNTVLHGAPVGILLLSADGEVIDRNDEAGRLLGDTGPDEIAGIVKAEGREVELAPGQWSEIRIQPLALEGEPDGLLVVLTDANERREARSRLARENEELAASIRASDEELQEFCFSVSHDLRGPLRAVDGFTQSVLSDREANLSDDNRDALLRVRRAATRMGELIDGLLVLSRISRAKMEPSALDLTAMMNRVANDLKRTYPDRDLQFDIAEGLTATADATLAGAMIDALLSNAVKFTAGRPQTLIEVLPNENGFVIRDNGVGFDMAYADKLFRPFEKLHPNAEFPGNGLGLAVASRILKRHGGHIEGQGEPGQGASFRISFGPVENP